MRSQIFVNCGEESRSQRAAKKSRPEWGEKVNSPAQPRGNLRTLGSRERGVETQAPNYNPLISQMVTGAREIFVEEVNGV